MRRDRGRDAVRTAALAACLLLLVAAGPVACGRALHTGAADAPDSGLAPAPVSSALRPSSQVDFRNAETTVLAYIDALRSGEASEAAQRMTPYRRAETSTHGWKRANSWWRAVRLTTVSRPGHYLTDERTFVRLYAERFGHAPYKLIVINVAYSKTTTASAGDVDFAVTKDTAAAPWLVNDFGGAVFTH